MKVYLVIRSYDHEGDEVLTVWSTREAANKERERCDDPEYGSFTTYYVREMEVQS